MKEQIEVITYEQERLNYFTNLMNKAQKRYKRLFKKFKDAPYLSAESEMLSDAGRETHFYGDVVEMLEKGYRRQEWISVYERLPETETPVLIFTKKGTYYVGYYYKGAVNPGFTGFYSNGCKRDATHWMPLPETPKMKGGAT